MRIAFECKNEKKLTGAQDIDIFARKLEYVGIPVRSGIFVSVAGYTQGAIENASDCGIKLLTYEDLDKKLPESVINAIQSVLYVICEFAGLNITSTLPPDANGTVPAGVLAFIYTEENGERQRVLIGDMLWHMWAVEGSIPDKIGMHEIMLQLPEDAFLLHNGKRYQILTDTEAGPPRVKVLVSGLVFNLKGNVRRHQLTNAQTRKVETYQVDVMFDAQERVTVRLIESESAFAELTHPDASIRLVTERFRMPRIVFNNSFWPPSQRVLGKVRSKVEAFNQGQLTDLRSLSFEEVEGTNLASMWEPISVEWPLYKQYMQGDIE